MSALTIQGTTSDRQAQGPGGGVKVSRQGESRGTGMGPGWNVRPEYYRPGGHAL